MTARLYGILGSRLLKRRVLFKKHGGLGPRGKWRERSTPSRSCRPIREATSRDSLLYPMMMARRTFGCCKLDLVSRMMDDTWSWRCLMFRKVTPIRTVLSQIFRELEDTQIVIEAFGT